MVIIVKVSRRLPWAEGPLRSTSIVSPFGLQGGRPARGGGRVWGKLRRAPKTGCKKSNFLGLSTSPDVSIFPGFAGHGPAFQAGFVFLGLGDLSDSRAGLRRVIPNLDLIFIYSSRWQ